LKAVIEVKGCYPHKDTWDAIIKILGESPDIAKMRDCWTAWRMKNYAPTNLGWLTDWYREGIPRVNGNGNYTKNTSNPRGNAGDFEFKPKSVIR
jgi:hypothetical protein